MDDLLNLFDFEKAARGRLEPAAYDYYASGAMDEVTLRENREAFDRIRLHYRVLRDVSRRDLSVELFGDRLALPVVVAPTAFQKMADPEGEAATARAAAGIGTAMILSTLATTSVEEVAEAAGAAPLWFQLYVYRDRAVTEALVRRAEAAGCRALVLTADAPLWGRRERDVRNRFRLPAGLRVENLLPAGMEEFPESRGDSGLAAYAASLFDPSLAWGDLEWLCSLTDLPVLLKGVVHPEDARRAAEHGANGIVVSNHGGRQLDTAPATIRVLARVQAAAREIGGDAYPVLLDGGIRRGTDVIKALALGADAVAVGRPILWGLAVGGARGAARVLDILRDEIDLAFGLCGCRTVGELRALGPELVEVPAP